MSSTDHGGGKRRSVTAFCHIAMPITDYPSRGEGDAMHVFTHSFDYIALGILIVCMLVAAAKAIPRRNS